MKNGKLLGTILMVVVGSAKLIAASPLTMKEGSKNHIIQLSELDDQVIQEFSNGKLNGAIIECPKGASFPFKLTLKGELLALDSASCLPLYLNVRKTCYICCDRGDFLISTDLQTWRGFSEFFTGELKVSIEPENGVPIVDLQLELNQRK